MNPPPYAPDRSSSSRLSFRPSNDSSTSRLAPLPSYQASLSSPSFVSSSQCLSASDHITPAPDLPWLQIGSAQDHLLIYLEDMYWQGVRRDLEVMILTLKKWQQPPCDPVILDDEQDDFIYGFDTFIDQVSERSREFATQYGKLLGEGNSLGNLHTRHRVSNHKGHRPYERLLPDGNNKFLRKRHSPSLNETLG